LIGSPAIPGSRHSLFFVPENARSAVPYPLRNTYLPIFKGLNRISIHLVDRLFSYSGKAFASCLSVPYPLRNGYARNFKAIAEE